MLHIENDLPAVGVGDILPGVDVVVVDDDGQTVSTGDLVGAAGHIVAPDGEATPVTVTPMPDDDSRLVVLFPSGYAFLLPGVYSLLLTLLEDGASVSVDAAPLVAEDRLSGWATLAHARAAWREAPRRDVTLWTVLDTARLQIVAYAPAQPAPEPPALPAPAPPAYRQAQVMQARNLWNAARTDPSQAGIGDDGLIIRPYPMDWIIKNVIRPRSPIPVVH